MHACDQVVAQRCGVVAVVVVGGSVKGLWWRWRWRWWQDARGAGRCEGPGPGAHRARDLRAIWGRSGAERAIEGEGAHTSADSGQRGYGGLGQDHLRRHLGAVVVEVAADQAEQVGHDVTRLQAC